MERTNEQRSGDSGIVSLYDIAALNIQRFVHQSPDVAWDTITLHLISIHRHPAVPQPIRLQPTRTLGDILVATLPRLTSAPAMQRRVLDVLAQQIMPSTATSTNMDLRPLALETLHQVLQASGHTLLVG